MKNSSLDIITSINILIFERKCLVYTTSLMNSTGSNGLGGQMAKGNRAVMTKVSQVEVKLDLNLNLNLTSSSLSRLISQLG
jgi:hypothetical protein